MWRFIIIPLIIALASCGASSGNGTRTCTDVYNLGQATTCNITTASLRIELIRSAYAATNVIVKPDPVSRGTQIISNLQVVNGSPDDLIIYARIFFDAGCAGAATWEIMPLQQFTISPGIPLDFNVGGSCGDMPLGARTMTTELYYNPADPEPFNRTEIQFDLTS